MDSQMQQISELSDDQLIDSLEKNNEQFTEEYIHLAKQELLKRTEKNPEIYKSAYVEKRSWEIDCIKKEITRLRAAMISLDAAIPYAVYRVVNDGNSPVLKISIWSGVLKIGIWSGVLCGIVSFIFLIIIDHRKKEIESRSISLSNKLK